VDGKLYFGGNKGFWDDTVYSLLQSSMYFKEYGQRVIGIAQICILKAICITGIGTLVLVVVERKLAASSLIICITMLCAAVCVIQFHLCFTAASLTSYLATHNNFMCCGIYCQITRSAI
jgi:hypothetical protein